MSFYPLQMSIHQNQVHMSHEWFCKIHSMVGLATPRDEVVQTVVKKYFLDMSNNLSPLLPFFHLIGHHTCQHFHFAKTCMYSVPEKLLYCIFDLNHLGFMNTDRIVTVI